VFIFYDDLVREAQKGQQAAAKKGKKVKEPDKRQEAIDRLLKIVGSLELDYDPLWGSMVKQAIRRVYPAFNEAYYGYRNFSDLLEEAQSQGLIELEHDQARGNYKIKLKKVPAATAKPS
jgi:hypothetical protein